MCMAQKQKLKRGNKMKVIVVHDPVLGSLLEMLFGQDSPLTKGGLGKFLPGVNLTSPMGTEEPDLKANPDFYTRPEVPKVLVLKVKSNTEAGKMYNVTRDRNDNLYCTCMGFKYRGKCRHVEKVERILHSGNNGLGLCIRCASFTKDERDLGGRFAKKGCTHHNTLRCPPIGLCKHFKFQGSTPEKKAVPMVFPVAGMLLQTFQSRHFPEVQYEVRLHGDKGLVCSCRGFNFHGTCKHVQYMKQRVNQTPVQI